MAISTSRIVASAKTKLADLLEVALADVEDADPAAIAEKMVDDQFVAIIEAIVEEIVANGETSGGETIS